MTIEELLIAFTFVSACSDFRVVKSRLEMPELLEDSDDKGASCTCVMARIELLIDEDGEICCSSPCSDCNVVIDTLVGLLIELILDSTLSS
jgi:hypothetical protein